MDVTRPLEILHVTDSLGHGGAEQNLLSILRRLPPDRYRNHLAWLYEDTRLLEKFRPHVASVVPLDAREGWGGTTAALRLARWIRAHSIDVVHTQLLRAQLVARTAALLAGRLPVVTTWQSTLYGENSLTEFRNSQRRLSTVRWMDRVTARTTRHFIAVSEFVADHCTRQLHVARDRVSVIYNSVEPDRYATVTPEALARTRVELGLAPDARVLLSVGRLVTSKAQADVIAAMPAILQRYPQAVYLLAGGGPLRAELEAQIQSLTLGDRVRLLGPRSDVAALYQLADVFEFATRSEGLSVALVEALANGLPTVASDIPPNHEVADGLEAVRFVPLRDPAAIAAATIDLLTNRTAARAAADRQRPRLHERFAPGPLALRFGETLDRVARG